MAQSQFVPKGKLIEQLRQITDGGQTGLLTILTEHSRSIFLRFSEGRLTRLYCRSGEAGEAIQLLAECEMCKFSYASAPEDSEGELMPAQSFLQLIEPGGVGSSGQRGSPIRSSAEMSMGDPVKSQMLEIATEYIGVVAEMIVDEAFEDNNDVTQAIDYIAGSIPDPNQSRLFRQAALEHFSPTIKY